MNTPCVSVVIPLYNKGNYIARTLDSVLKQSFSDFEVIVVNNGSTDGSEEIVKSFSDPRLRLISQQNAGVSAARNRGIMEAKSDFVAFLDADDQWHPEFLSTLWATKNKYPHGRFFASSREIVNKQGTRTSLDFGYEESVSMDLMEFMDCCVRLRSPLIPSAVMVHKPLLKQVGMFPVGQNRGEDLDTWVRLLLEGPVVYHNKPLAVYWEGLPLSACSVCQEVYLEGNQLLCTLEDKIREGVYRGKDRERVLDYLAWYMASPVERLIASGRCAEARSYIFAALRSKRMRKQYLLAYLRSFYPSVHKSLVTPIARALAAIKAPPNPDK
jgi:hypothetical protein